MTTAFVQEGKTINFVTAGAVAQNAVLPIGSMTGVALSSASGAGQTIAVALRGVHRVPKLAGVAWTAGQRLVWDASGSAFGTVAQVTLAAGDVTGPCVAWASAASGDTVGLVKLTPHGQAVVT